MSNVGLYVLMWPDMFHRVTRRVAGALAASSAGSLMKKLNRMFKYSRGPFATSKNGRTLSQMKTELLSSLKSGVGDELAEMYMSGIARDMGRDISTFSMNDLIKALQKKPGKVD